MNTFSSWHRNDTRWRPVLSDYENKSSHHFITTGCDWTFVWDLNRQMKGQSEIAYLPKFANMMLIVMVIVITEILYIILIFDCFENQ